MNDAPPTCGADQRTRRAVRCALTIRGLQHQEVARALGLSPARFSRFLAGHVELAPAQIVRIWRCVGVEDHVLWIALVDVLSALEPCRGERQASARQDT